MKVISRYRLNGVPLLVLDENGQSASQTEAEKLELVLGEGRADMNLQDIRALKAILADAEAILTARAEKAFLARNMSLDLS